MAKAKSAKQQMAAGAALSAKRGKRPKSSLKGASRSMVESMSEEDLDAMASSKRKKLPRRGRASKKAAKKKTAKIKTAKKKTVKRKTVRKPTTKRKTAKKRATRRR
ncbi:DUF3008 family protein [uncultured Ferrovibrio sp.]|jgi:Protein of unknwon function (DUF3008).|uniref:DUF3008 family protein n=1 Tax=uncultured Ferrovibrio sp. TaxID=1576913 RepID=UPI00261224BA|nr:DUF3008 family protein [uncultured Ferrovibrio sp.]